MAPEPIFLLSPPRSGSTLLQRVLSTHPDIATTPEPWLLLPMFQAFRPDATLATHDQSLLARALGDFTQNLPNGQDDMDTTIRDCAISLYRKASHGERFFLDKTPRYSLIVDDIIRAFPKAKFIFLFRDPVAVTQSMNTTWGKGNWVLFRHYIDLFDGMENLAKAARTLGPRAHSLTYERFLQDTAKETRLIYTYLGLPEPEAAPTAPPLSGQMGDPTQAPDIGTKSPDWRQTPLTAARRIWLNLYLSHLGEETLSRMGYNQQSLLDDLAKAPRTRKGLGSDMSRIGYGAFYRHLSLPLLRAKGRRRKSGRVAIAYK